MKIRFRARVYEGFFVKIPQCVAKFLKIERGDEVLLEVVDVRWKWMEKEE